MKIILVDFENVHSDGVAGVDSLSENDEVVIFYSNNADSITFEMMHKLMFCKAKLSYYKVRRGGRNALDFQMASYLGYLVKQYADTPGVEFYLISKDAGFDFVVDFWESGNINIKPKVKRFFAIKAVFAKSRMLQKESSATPANESTAPMEAPTETVAVEVAPIPSPVKPSVVVKTPVKKVELVEVDVVEEVASSAKTVAVQKEPVRKAPAKTTVAKSPAKKKPVVAKSAAKNIAETPVEAVLPVETETAEPAPFVMDFDVAAEVDRLLSTAKSSHGLYISMVKRFGQKKGVEIYRNTKSRFFAQMTG